jgi:hypothetical protein
MPQVRAHVGFISPTVCISINLSWCQPWASPLTSRGINRVHLHILHVVSTVSISADPRLRALARLIGSLPVLPVVPLLISL